MLQGQLSQFARMASAPREFGALQVRERVITTTGLAIGIENISTVSTFEDTNASWIVLALLALGALVAAVAAPPALVAALLLGWLAYRGWRKRNSYRLVISTNDGARFHFIGKDPRLVSEVREFITRKMDQRDPRLTLNVNLEKGTIENLNVGQLYADTVVAGDNNQVASNSPGAKVGTADTTQTTHTTTHTANHYTATNSPGAQVGAGNQSWGATVAAPVTQTITRIDYSPVLPQIEYWQRSAAATQGWEHVAERLARLEALLKDGTPAPEQKQVARSLAAELSHILQGYPAAVQLFQGVLRLIGM